MSMSSSNRLYFDRSSSLPLSSPLLLLVLLLLLLEEYGSFRGALEFLLLAGAGWCRFSFLRESLSLDELDFRSRFGGDFRTRFLLLLSDEEDEELLSLDLSRDLDLDLDLERDLERVSRLLERFELIDLLLLFFFRRPNSSYSESEGSRSLYSTTSRSLYPPPYPLKTKMN